MATSAHARTNPFPKAETGLQRRLRFVRQYAAWRRAVRELWRFKWREHRAEPRLGAYHTRRGRVAYFIRHGTRDVGIFSEIFVAGEYDPPSAVTERLDALGRPPRILDLGANVGLFTASCLERWPGASVVAVEPDPENLQLLERMARMEARIEVVPACAGARDGSVRFLAGLFAESQVVPDGHEGETLELPCVDAFRLAESADLVKIDIEGSEWEILADPRLAQLGAAALVMEWHDKSCPHADPGAAAREALERAGFKVLSEHRPVPQNGTLWAIRPAG
jgi:FkbM family methyltransferase